MKEIKLNNGYSALVDDEDYEYLNQFHWNVTVDPKRPEKRYPRREIKRVKNTKRKRVLMHVEIMKPQKGMQIDHIDHNTLNNQKSNLRICNSYNNSWNRKPNKGKKYKGVHKENIVYGAIISFRNKNIRIGTFDDEIYAAKCYDHFARKLYGEYAYLNFPDDESTINMEIKKRLYIMSAETKSKISKSNIGKKYSIEARKKMSEKIQQFYAQMTPEERKERNKYLLGNKHSLGRKLSEEHKKKIGESNKKHYQNKFQLTLSPDYKQVRKTEL